MSRSEKNESSLFSKEEEIEKSIKKISEKQKLTLRKQAIQEYLMLKRGINSEEKKEDSLELIMKGVYSTFISTFDENIAKECSEKMVNFSHHSQNFSKLYPPPQFINSLLKVLFSNFLDSVLIVRNVLIIIGNTIIDNIEKKEELRLIIDNTDIINSLSFFVIDLTKEDRQVSLVLEDFVIWNYHLLLSYSETSLLKEENKRDILNSIPSLITCFLRIYKENNEEKLFTLCDCLMSLSNEEEFCLGILKSGYFKVVAEIFEYFFIDYSSLANKELYPILSSKIVEKIINISTNIFTLGETEVSENYSPNCNAVFKEMIRRYQVYNSEYPSFQDFLISMLANVCMFKNENLVQVISDEKSIEILFTKYLRFENIISLIHFIENAFTSQEKNALLIFIHKGCFNVVEFSLKTEKKEVLKELLRTLLVMARNKSVEREVALEIAKRNYVEFLQNFCLNNMENDLTDSLDNLEKIVNAIISDNN